MPPAPRRPAGARPHSGLGAARRLAPLLTVAALFVLALGQVPVQPPADGSRGVETGRATSPVSTPITLLAAQRVELKRRQGYVTGDGRTRYVANRTEFRPRRATVALPPRLRGSAWIVVDLDTGRTLGRNAHRARLPQASTIKLLTALTAFRTIPPGTQHKVTRWEAGQVCSCVGLKPGRRYDRDTLVTGMLLRSGNDAAEAVAGAHPQGRSAFYAAMNAVARELGASDTVAKNASGLSAWGSHSSARDLVLLLRAAVADPQVHAILSLTSAEIATIHGGHRRTVWRTTDYVNKVPGSLGKSGWTTPAQNTLTVVTEVEGRRIAFASLGVPTGYSTDGAIALTTWAAQNLTGLASLGRLPGS